MSKDIIYREDAIGAINGWLKRNHFPEIGDGILYLVPSADRPNKTKAELIMVMEEYRDKQLLMSDYWYGINWAINTIRTADITDRPQGEWIRTAGEYIGDDVSGFYDYHWACSECEREAIINDWNIYELSNYCPNCGARMKGSDDE